MGLFTPKYRPQIARESPSKLASLTLRVGKGVNGISEMGSIYTQMLPKTLAAETPPESLK